MYSVFFIIRHLKCFDLTLSAETCRIGFIIDESLAKHRTVGGVLFLAHCVYSATCQSRWEADEGPVKCRVRSQTKCKRVSCQVIPQRAWQCAQRHTGRRLDAAVFYAQLHRPSSHYHTHTHTHTFHQRCPCFLDVLDQSQSQTEITDTISTSSIFIF